jgi:hypothetical protein
MKKILLIALALGLAVALAAPAMATDWSARGHIWVGGAIHKTVPPSGPPQFPAFFFWGGPIPPYVPVSPLNPDSDAWGDTYAWMRMGANLTITARQSEDLYGVLGFNMNSSRWGEWGGEFDATAAGSWYRPNNDDSGTLSVLVQDMYIDFRVPPKLPIWLRIGAQPFVIRPWLVVNTVGPGITGRVTIDPIKLSINAGWAKKWEGYDWDCDDVDAFFGDIAIPIGPVRIGGFVWYENHGIFLANQGPPNIGLVQPYPDAGKRDQADIYWLGFYADGKIGPVGLQFDFVYEGGDINYDPDWYIVNGLVTPQDQDIRAWVIRGVLDVSPMDRLKVGVGALYASGQDLNDNDVEEYQSVDGPEGYGRQQGLPALQDFFMLTGGCMGIVPSRGPMTSFFGGPTSIGGIWYVRGFADYMATDWLRLIANFGWIGDTRDHGNKLGTALNAAGNPRDDDDIGFEMDFGFNIALYKNLQWGVGFSYLIAGDALDQVDGAGVNHSPADPWQLQSAILYTF